MKKAWCHQAMFSPLIPRAAPALSTSPRITRGLSQTEVNVDRLLSDFVDDAIHAGNDLAVLGRVECSEFVGGFAGVWVSLEGIDLFAAADLFQ
jgi:hypothetical protein